MRSRSSSRRQTRRKPRSARARLLEELADLAEIFDFACGLFEIKPADLIAARNKKRREKGGFEKRLLLIDISQKQ
ncbi:MAG TPA: hypothetical protein VHC68_01365 [Candidatus Paceibacterota bacterium]|nr:hypothetical protein [Candidatus Paceibacterota bacterium]